MVTEILRTRTSRFVHIRGYPQPFNFLGRPPVPKHVQVIRRRQPVQAESRDDQTTLVSTVQVHVAASITSPHVLQMPLGYSKLFRVLYISVLFGLPARYCGDAVQPQTLGSDDVTGRNLCKRWIKEWAQMRSVAGILFSVLFTILQISSASYDPMVRTVVQLSIVCLFFGAVYACILLMKFGKLEAEGAARVWIHQTIPVLPRNTFWNTWIMLAMPLVWIIW
ncbi:hypothetical protein B0H17DRAFT_302835 [Mycena rosella]|uniref:Uncharacterized protein n=1 Tax=Mycena rosella TaxID=1033263 RepID=A0AAD7G7S8_MYCRO|nr:hypothetical protein B0H17DRAFT_302835 [Mycena rosella]